MLLFWQIHVIFHQGMILEQNGNTPSITWGVLMPISLNLFLIDFVFFLSLL